MIRVERVVEAGIAPEHAAAFLLDFASTAIWDPHTVECRRIDTGPVDVGARYRNVQRIAGRESELEYTVAQYIPGRLISLDGEGTSVAARDTIDIQASGTGTRVTYTAHFAFTGAQRRAEPLLRLVIKRIADDGAKGMAIALRSIAHAVR